MIEMIQLLKKAARAPKKVLWCRLKQEAWQRWERYVSSPQLPTEQALCRSFSVSSIAQLWEDLSARPFPCATDQTLSNAFSLEEKQTIMERADAVMQGRVSWLGLEDIILELPIAWSRDHRSGEEWPQQYWSQIAYTDLDSPSDVKYPWELSRLQWLIPVGQAYVLTQEERYAERIKHLLEDWMQSNPYAHSVNWACTMEVAMRIFVWTWLFRVCANALSWRDQPFQTRFLATLFAHGAFTERYCEYSTVNGNHCTADAAALVWLGLFFEAAPEGKHWAASGWRLLEEELAKQVGPDGVDFEASSAYHRLVGELFFWPAFYRERCGLSVSAFYRDRLKQMANVTQAYTKPNGQAPLWGDADDARVLPFGMQPLNDHRYFCDLIGVGLEQKLECSPESYSELIWIFGDSLKKSETSFLKQRQSQMFADMGIYVMATAEHHVFIDAGPVGLAGRGGHGHNDALSFEAFLKGVPLITDSGCYVYTGSALRRNQFRSTASHNTPQIDGEEINRWTGPRDLWTLHDDAKPQVERWFSSVERDEWCGRHEGYLRLNDPVLVRRSVLLEKHSGVLQIIDELSGAAQHAVRIPIHFDPQVEVLEEHSWGEPHWLIASGTQKFWVFFEGEHPASWTVRKESGWVSPSYRVKRPNSVAVCEYQGVLPVRFKMHIKPVD